MQNFDEMVQVAKTPLILIHLMGEKLVPFWTREMIDQAKSPSSSGSISYR